MFYVRRAWAARTFPHSPAIPGRCSWGLRALVLHAIGIPCTAWLPRFQRRALGISGHWESQGSPLPETCSNQAVILSQKSKYKTITWEVIHAVVKNLVFSFLLLCSCCMAYTCCSEFNICAKF